MRTKTINLYQFDELSDEAKQKAIESLSGINVDFEWWEFVYEDAEQIGLKITEFDIDRGMYAKGEFIEGAEDVANAILKNHGEDCETYKTAKGYLTDRDELVAKYSDGVNTDVVAEEDEYYFDQDCDELDDSFRIDLLDDYRIILDKEWDYLTSEEAVIGTIRANEYEFTEDGSPA
jgi:hypothetical protein